MALAEAIHRRIPERWVRRWPTIRALLVGYHVLAVLVLAFPAPPGNMQRKAWENPTVQDELAQWSARLRGLGADVSASELDDTLYGLAKRYHAGRARVIAPFEPYATYAGVRQSWQLFAGPQRYPLRLEVSLREGAGKWRTIYESRSDEHHWRSDLFERYRMRRVVSMTTWGDKHQLDMLCDWIATQAARDFPAATEVMIRQFRYRTPSPAEALEGKTALEGKYISREVRKLKAQP
jgi:hypothetical protein